jgi:hypothetical protein
MALADKGSKIESRHKLAGLFDVRVDWHMGEPSTEKFNGLSG